MLQYFTFQFYLSILQRTKQQNDTLQSFIDQTAAVDLISKQQFETAHKLRILFVILLFKFIQILQHRQKTFISSFLFKISYLKLYPLYPYLLPSHSLKQGKCGFAFYYFVYLLLQVIYITETAFVLFQTKHHDTARKVMNRND